ncbi:transposase [Desertivirga xinjiangensis]|uniref:transposase n=1 Tax=Desertivirga xinjiangensis TaxID=539206 RepID=UPI00210E3853
MIIRLQRRLSGLSYLTINLHHNNILNYFDTRSTNASAESFNAKIKAFRAQYRGVGNVNFFLLDL